jgi:hypothetical protein
LACKGEVHFEIIPPEQVCDRVKRLAEDGVQDLFPMLANRQPTTAENFVGELRIGRLRDFGITADSTDIQTLKTELATKQGELEKALKPRVLVVRKLAVAVAAAVVKRTRNRGGELPRSVNSGKSMFTAAVCV